MPSKRQRQPSSTDATSRDPGSSPPGETPTRPSPTSTSASTPTGIRQRPRPLRSCLPRGKQAVQRHGDARAPRYGHQAVQFRAADNRIRYQQIRRFRVQHHLRFAHLRHRQPGRAQIESPPCVMPRRFMRLRMRAQAAGTVRLGVFGHAAQVALHSVQIHQQGGRIDFRYQHQRACLKRMVILSPVRS